MNLGKMKIKHIIQPFIYLSLGMLSWQFWNKGFDPRTWFESGDHLYILLFILAALTVAGGWVNSIASRVSKLEASLAEDEPAEKEAENEEKK